jgi:hypothetical protein
MAVRLLASLQLARWRGVAWRGVAWQLTYEIEYCSRCIMSQKQLDYIGLSQTSSMEDGTGSLLVVVRSIGQRATDTVSQATNTGVVAA